MVNRTANSSSIQNINRLNVFKEFSLGSANGSVTSKALADPSLSQWLEDATAYYNEVLSGQTPKPSEGEWNQFMQWMSWAKTQAMSGGNAQPWDPMTQNMGGAPAKNGINDFGGELGPDGNFNYDMVQTKLGFTGDQTRNDIYGTNNELNLNQPSAKVTCETSMDHGVDVLKVVVTTAKGTAVYYYDNYQDPAFKLNLSVPNIDNVIGAENFASKIEVKKFDPVADAADKGSPMASIEGKANEETGKTEYVANGEETVDFWPQELAADGKARNHRVWGDANVVLPGGFHAQAMPVWGDGGVVGLKLVVTDRNGKVTDIYEIEKSYTLDIQGNKDYIRVGNKPEGGGVPSLLEKDIFINGGSGSEEIEESPVNSQALDGINALVKATGVDENVLLASVNDAYGWSYGSIDELASSGKFPPKTPDTALIELLCNLDDELFSDYQDWKTELKGENKNAQVLATETFNDTLTDRLTALYGPQGKLIRPGDSNTYYPTSAYFSFGKENLKVSIDQGKLVLDLEEAP